ncbi:FAD-binding oxidoreductase [Roseateles sp. SL47]|uniref:FAD-binding oxidoreductase n=1 Tax=Roseateles sp. SL47 TaxID=2995138 RepID=UPI0022712A0F|nr:FAD-binding oxidoreductase [Roseateles sp. SL47]WAC71964.1 FAD-binding oxidoreductase [Roseateles sp. SL47]
MSHTRISPLPPPSSAPTWVLPADTSASTFTLLDQLRAAVGDAGVSTDADTLAVAAQDVFQQGGLPLAVLRPGNVEALQAAVRCCASAGVAMVPRGGGASYTDGYLLATGGHVLIDVGALNDINIDPINAVVTVGAGVTWATLRERLAPHGLRTPFWGPFSGRVATIGGSVSQHTISHGSAAHGGSAQSVLGMDVVLASGALLRTGPGLTTRHDGPDLTGLFTGDCGALGIKAALRLPLIAAKPHAEALSFAFNDFSSFHELVRLSAREGLDDEHFGLDQSLSQGQIGRQQGLGDRLRIARQVMASAKSIPAGLRQLLRMALAGDRVMTKGAYMAHFIVEGATATEAAAKADRLRLLAMDLGQEIANTVPGFVKAMPFAPLTNVLGPKGERWVPVHGILSHRQAAAFHTALQALRDRNEADMTALGVWMGTMFSAIGSTGLLYEIALYWPGRPDRYHQALLGADHLATLPQYEDSPQAAGLAARIKQELVSLYAAHGASFLQLGRAYPYTERLDPAALALLRSVKSELDPQNLMNPGVLGLGT